MLYSITYVDNEYSDYANNTKIELMQRDSLAKYHAKEKYVSVRWILAAKKGWNLRLNQ